MEVRDFAQFHTPALQRDEARYNRMLGYLARLLNSAQPNPHLRLWTLGASGQCAMQTSPRNPIILGELDEGQCRALAEETVGLDYQGVLGADPTVCGVPSSAVSGFLNQYRNRFWRCASVRSIRMWAALLAWWTAAMSTAWDHG
jgi:hypothetical protein